MKLRFPDTKTLLATTVAIFGLSTALLAEEAMTNERGLLTQKREFKGYQKRLRIMPNVYNNYYSPSQLHEVYGLEVGAAAEYNVVSVKIPQYENEIRAPGARASVAYSGDMVVLGMDAGFTNISVDPNNTTQVNYFYNIYQIEPKAAVSFNDNFTLGFSSAITMSDLTKEKPQTYEDKAAHVFNRYIVNNVGFSFHNEKMETGIAYSTVAKDSRKFDDFEENSVIYVPANTTVFARGNLTDELSLLGAVSYVDYERSAEGSQDTFNKYRLEDRLASRLALTYWTQERSSLSITGKYTPATYYGPFNGALNLGLIDRNANLYGGMIDYAYSFNKRMSYFGLSAGLDRGERNQTVDNVRYAAKENIVKVGASLNFKM